MRELTINEAIALINQLKSRKSALSAMRQEVSTKESHWYGEQRQKIVEPQYDVKSLDQKIVELDNWLFQLDAAVKAANARTTLGLKVPVEELLKPLS